MKRLIVHFLVGVCAAGLACADQTIQSVQQALKDQGFYYGNVTGDKSAETTAAIRRYQIRSGLQVTGEANPETLSSLKLNSKSVSSSQRASKPAVTQSNRTTLDDSSRVSSNSPLPASNEPEPHLDASAAASDAPYQSVPPRMNSRMIVAEVQRQLMGRGYYRGRIDGRYGRGTAFAMRAFQLQSGLPPTGHVDRSTLEALGISGENLASLQSAPRANETWVPITKFKHGKWKVKWKKYPQREDDYREAGQEQMGDAWWGGGRDE